MVRERGSGETPERLVKLLTEAKSLLAIAKETGVGKSALSRYAKGIGEPTTASLQRLADYFGCSVSWLRDDDCTEEKGTVQRSYICAVCENPVSAASERELESGHTEVRIIPCEACCK